MKKINELTEQELLCELVKGQRRQAMLSAAVLIATLLLVGILSWFMFVALPQFAETVEKADNLIEEVSVVVDKAGDALSDIDEMVGSINDLVQENTEALSSTIGEISKIDISSLNKSIEELSEVVEPMSKLFTVFNR